MIKLVSMVMITAYTWTLTGQVTHDTITIQKKFGGYQYYQNDMPLNIKKLVRVMEPNQKAYTEIKAAEYKHFLVRGLNNAGVLFILLPVIFLAKDEDPHWYLAGIGAGLLAINIPITRKYNKQVQKAIHTYNAN